MIIELNSIRLKLEQMRQQVIEELGQLMIASSPSKERLRVSSFYSREEAVDATSDFERRIALENQKRNNLAEVEHALQKLDGGSYGICDRCGLSIESARLEALPYTSHCMACKSACK